MQQMVTTPQMNIKCRTAGPFTLDENSYSISYQPKFLTCGYRIRCNNSVGPSYTLYEYLDVDFEDCKLMIVIHDINVLRYFNHCIAEISLKHGF